MLTAHSIRSEVQLQFTRRDNGETVLSRRRTGGLAHVGKSYWTGDVLRTQVVNPTAGFFAGDDLHFSVEVCAGAQVMLNQPGATRFHTMEPGAQATIHQRFTVGDGASLDLYPDLSISQRGSSMAQRTQLHLAPTAICCFLEILTPGRIAHGDALEWSLLSNQLDLFRDGLCLTRERMHLGPADTWRLLSRDGVPLHVATFWLHHPDVAGWQDVLGAPSDPLTDPVQQGYTVLDQQLACLRLASTSSVDLRNRIDTLRQTLHQLTPLLGTSNALY